MDYGYYDYGYSYDAGSAVTAGLGILGGLFAFLWIILIIAAVVGILQLIATWKVFKKAGKGGWEAIIPFYCNWVLVEISGLKWWWFLFFFAPFVTSFINLDWLGYLAYLFATFNCYYNLSKKFNKGVGFAVCLTLFTPICLMILGFSKNNVYSNVVVSDNGVIPPTKGSNNGGNVNNNYQNPVQQQNYSQQMNNVQPVQSTVQPVNNQQPVYNQPVQPVQPVQPETNVTDSLNQMVPPTLQPNVAPTCSKCGAPVNAGDKFCMSCGNQL